jgi:hypothetical protein
LSNESFESESLLVSFVPLSNFTFLPDAEDSCFFTTGYSGAPLPDSFGGVAHN